MHFIKQLVTSKRLIIIHIVSCLLRNRLARTDLVSGLKRNKIWKRNYLVCVCVDYLQLISVYSNIFFSFKCNVKDTPNTENVYLFPWQMNKWCCNIFSAQPAHEHFKMKNNEAMRATDIICIADWYLPFDIRFLTPFSPASLIGFKNIYSPMKMKEYVTHV